MLVFARRFLRGRSRSCSTLARSLGLFRLFVGGGLGGGGLSGSPLALGLLGLLLGFLRLAGCLGRLGLAFSLRRRSATFVVVALLLRGSLGRGSLGIFRGLGFAGALRSRRPL